MKKLKMNYFDDTETVTVSIGDEFSLYRGRRSPLTLRVVRTTTKGINFLIVEHDRLLSLRRHYYDRKWAGKAIPPGTTTFKIRVWSLTWRRMTRIEKAKEA